MQSTNVWNQMLLSHTSRKANAFSKGIQKDWFTGLSPFRPGPCMQRNQITRGQGQKKRKKNIVVEEVVIAVGSWQSAAQRMKQRQRRRWWRWRRLIPTHSMCLDLATCLHPTGETSSILVGLFFYLSLVEFWVLWRNLMGGDV